MSFTTADLWSEGRNSTLTIIRNSPTTIQLNWTIPENTKAYDGYVLLLSTSILESAQQPTDGVRYTGTTDLNLINDTIGGAIVITSKYFLSSTQPIPLTGTITVGNIDPNLTYYASLHICSNTLQYFPFGAKSYALDAANIAENVDGYTGSIPQSNEVPLNPILGQVYFNKTNQQVFMWNGAAWIQASTDTVKTGISFPTTPNLGEFFYQTSTHILFIWNGTNWSQANTDQIGTPSYDKTNVGTTGSIDERERLAHTLKTLLGWPGVCNELKEENFETAINVALSQFRRRSDSAYEWKHVMLALQPDQNIYYLNDPVIGTDKIVDIQKVHRINTIGLNALGGDGSNIYAQAVINSFFYGAMVDILSIHLLHSLGEEYKKIFAGDLIFEWNEMKREIKILRKVYKVEKVILECFMERTEQELLNDRWCKDWIRDWALAVCWEMLGQIRTKYGTLASATGGLTLNGDTLLQKSETMYQELLRQINDFEVGNNYGHGNCAFLLG
jgi:hypothetical protein